jgi:putative flippase GtrA
MQGSFEVGVGGLTGVLRRLWRELVGFGVVGVVGYLTDALTINVLYGRVPSVVASAAGVTLSTVVAYLGNKFWTFRKRDQRSTGTEAGLFLLVSAGGFLITVASVWFTVHVLGYSGRVAVNVAQLIAGQALGTLLRFWACHALVFPEQRSAPAEAQVDADEPAVHTSRVR